MAKIQRLWFWRVDCVLAGFWISSHSSTVSAAIASVAAVLAAPLEPTQPVAAVVAVVVVVLMAPNTCLLTASRSGRAYVCFDCVASWLCCVLVTLSFD